MPLQGLDLSSAARAGLTAFLAAVARGVAARNVTLNNLLPGSFATQRLRSGLAASAPRGNISEADAEHQSRAQIPAQRCGTAAQFGQTCAMLCNVHAGCIIGQHVVIDGGRYASAF